MDNMNILLIVVLIVKQITAVSYNQPNFCPMVSWKLDAITLANSATIGQQPYSIFINKNNTVYVAAPTHGIIKMELEGIIHHTNTSTVSTHLLNSISVFVTSNNDIYAYIIDKDDDNRNRYSAQIDHPIVKRDQDSKVQLCCYIWDIFCFWPFVCTWENTESGNNGHTNSSSSYNNSDNNQKGNHGKVYKWSLNATDLDITMNVNGSCFGIFVDINDTIYCSITDHHQVVKKSLDANPHTFMIAAGNGSNGSASNTFSHPGGIFVSISFDLYVADSFNHRIQRFRLGNLNGETVAGHEAIGTMTLKYPTGIALDANQFLFIVDSGNHRIIWLGPNGFRCLVGCSGGPGSESNQLFYPTTLSFDSYGNMFVVDTGNSRIQKFILASNSCASGPFILDISYNRPKFCPSATWNSTATTFADKRVAGQNPYGLFIDASNTIYVANQKLHHVDVWTSGSINITKHIFRNILNASFSLFVTYNGDIFADNGVNGRVEKWSVNATSNVSVMNVNNSCYGLFVDLNNTIYCSIRFLNQVIKLSLDIGNNTSTIAAGNGSNGSASNMLSEPYGIFVDINFDLYVADCLNNRIQVFQPGNLTGTTTVGNGSKKGINLSYPTGVVLDADGNLFVVDSCNHRILLSGLNGFRCLVGCSNTGSGSDRLDYPATLSFDSYGNMFVADTGNSRIQKFILLVNSCNETTTQVAPSTSISVMNTERSSNLTPSTLIPTTTGKIISKTPPSVFVTPTCNGSTPSGITCDELNSPCQISRPCQNNGTCNDTNTLPTGYSCSCLPHFKGTECQYDHRPCKPDTCWNNGTCIVLLNTSFKCICEQGWQGDNCETKINYCLNVTCENNGVCRPLFMNYKCECLGESYSGRHCEITATKIKIYKIVSKSFAYVAIIAMISVAMFIVIMDILKYCFGIDPVYEERERIRRSKKAKKRKPVIQRFVYVNAPPTKVVASTIIETNV